MTAGRALVAFAAAVLMIVPAFAPAQPRPDPMHEMTAKINDAAGKINRVRQLKGKKIAVGEFRMVDNKSTELATLIANLLEVALSNQTDLELVSRSDLCQVIRENKLWVSDQFDPQAAKKMGNFSQADFLVPGVDSREVARWIAESAAFDRLYFYDPDRPLHVSVGPENTRQVVYMRRTTSGRRVPRVVAAGKL